jgi:hypothetical protein
MANLKDPSADIAAAMQQVKEAGEAGTAQVINTARRAQAEIHDAAWARASLQGALTEAHLLMCAAVAIVGPAYVQRADAGPGALDRVSYRMRSGHEYHALYDARDAYPLPPGIYRPLFFLVRVDAERGDP